MVKRIVDEFYANDNWMWLGIVYRLDLFMRAPNPQQQNPGHPQQQHPDEHHAPPDPARAPIVYPHTSLKTPKRLSRSRLAYLKSYADVFEAYFEGVISEREMWGESLADVEGFFRILMLRKYKGLIPFLMNLDLDLQLGKGIAPDERNHGVVDGDCEGFTAGSCKVQAILRRDEVMERVFGKIRDDGGDTYPYGRLITYPESSESVSEDIYVPDRTRFARDENLEPAMAALLYARGAGLKGTPGTPTTSPPATPA